MGMLYFLVMTLTKRAKLTLSALVDQ